MLANPGETFLLDYLNEKPWKENNEEGSKGIITIPTTASKELSLTTDNFKFFQQADKNGESLLHKAVKANDHQSVKLLAAVGCNINAVTIMAELVEIIVTNGIDHSTYKDILNNHHYRGNVTPIILAIEFADEEMVKLLLNLGADINQRVDSGSYRESALELAVALEKESIVKLLIDNGADVNDPGSIAHGKSSSALHLAVMLQNKNIISILLANNCDVNILDSGKYTPLHLVAESGNEEIIKMLLDNGASLLCSGKTPLYAALEAMNLASVKIIMNELKKQFGSSFKLDASGFIRIMDSYAFFKLTKLQTKHKEFLDYVIHNLNVDLNEIMPEENGKTIISYLYKNTIQGYSNSKEVVIELIKHGARIDIKDNSGESFLDLVLKNNDIIMIKGLLAMGFNIVDKIPNLLLEDPTINLQLDDQQVKATYYLDQKNTLELHQSTSKLVMEGEL